MELLGNDPIAEEMFKLIGYPKRHPKHEPHSHGWFLDTHRAVFSSIISAETRVIIELGSWYGASSRWLAENSEAVIFAIDLWDDSFILADDHYEGSKLAQMLKNHPLYPTFLANTWDLQERIVPLRMATTDGLQFLYDRGIQPDVIYIDADHHYSAAKNDISTALRLFPRALLVGDDYGNYDDVRRAVHECANEAMKTVHVDNNHCWAYCSISSTTGRNIPPKMASGGVKRLMESYRRRMKAPVADANARVAVSEGEKPSSLEKPSTEDDPARNETIGSDSSSANVAAAVSASSASIEKDGEAARKKIRMN